MNNHCLIVDGILFFIDISMDFGLHLAPFGSLWGALGLPLAVLWGPFGRLGAPVGALWGVFWILLKI